MGGDVDDLLAGSLPQNASRLAPAPVASTNCPLVRWLGVSLAPRWCQSARKTTTKAAARFDSPRIVRCLWRGEQMIWHPAKPSPERHHF